MYPEVLATQLVGQRYTYISGLTCNHFKHFATTGEVGQLAEQFDLRLTDLLDFGQPSRPQKNYYQANCAVGLSDPTF